jgi:HEAT repeat protein
MSPAGKAELLIAALIVSGCFQEVAPRHETPAPVTATATGQLAIVRQFPDAPVDEATAVVPQLAGRLQEDDDPKSRREALYLIADSGGSGDAALIGQALYDPDATVRLAAVEALTGLEDVSSADWMLVALGDPEPQIRRTAVEALGEIRGGTARLLLKQALLDADESVRAAARQTLDEPEFRERGIR